MVSRAALVPLALLPLAFLLGALSGDSAASLLGGALSAAQSHKQLRLEANVTVVAEEEAAAGDDGGRGAAAAPCGATAAAAAAPLSEDMPLQPEELPVLVVPAPIPAARRTLSDAWRLQIQRDLAPFRAAGGVTRAAVDAAAALKDWRQIRVLIHQNQLYVHPDQSHDAYEKDGRPHSSLRLLLKASGGSGALCLRPSLRRGGRPLPPLHRFHAAPPPPSVCAQVLCHYKVPDVELVINHADRPVVPKHGGHPLPVFSWCKTANYW